MTSRTNTWYTSESVKCRVLRVVEFLVYSCTSAPQHAHSFDSVVTLTLPLSPYFTKQSRSSPHLYSQTQVLIAEFTELYELT